MVNQHQEGYSPYCPNETNWYMLKRTRAQKSDGLAASDMGYLTVCGTGVDIHWVIESRNDHSFAAADYFEVCYSLEAGETLTFTEAIRAGEPIPAVGAVAAQAPLGA